jgi:glycosyltransferase involved in cell wall biosynthesis
MSGGIRVIVIYAQQLMRMGHAVRIISPPPRQAIPVSLKLKSWLKGNGWLSGSPPSPSHLDHSGVDHHILDCWRPVIDDDVPDGDVVIATWWQTAEWVNALSPSKGAKVYFIQHHEIFSHLPVERCHATYRLPLHKIVVAQWLKEAMSVQYGDNIVDVVPNSVDQAQFFAPIRGKRPVPTAGFLYSTVGFKGLDVTLAALRVVRQSFPNLRLMSFGSERPALASSLPENVEFSFCPPQDQLRQIYAQCDVWITASRSEGFNLPAMEAMACRTPVAATHTGWPGEAMRSHQNGILVDVDDWKALAEGVAWILSLSDERWRDLSASAYATVKSGSWQTSARLFEAALEHARQRFARGELQREVASTGAP